MYTHWLKRTHPEFIQPCYVQPAEPSNITDEFSHIRPLSPEAVFEENDDRSVESRQEVENVVYNSPTGKCRIVILMMQHWSILELGALDWLECWQITLHMWRQHNDASLQQDC